jgi:hypothetical protein
MTVLKVSSVRWLTDLRPSRVGLHHRVEKRIVRINAVPRERVYGRSLISLRSPSPTAQISESSRRMMPDCSSVRPDNPASSGGTHAAAEAHGGRGDQKLASAAASI